MANKTLFEIAFFLFGLIFAKPAIDYIYQVKKLKKLKIMKKGLLLSAIMFCSVVSAFSAVTIHYKNTDAKAHQMAVKMDGTTKSVVFEASKTTSVTIAGSGKSAMIQTSCGVIEVKDGQNVTIKNGCITITKGK
jgi:hypothetical protein